MAALILAGCARSGVVKEPAAVAPTGPSLASTTLIASATQPGPPTARGEQTTSVSCPSATTMLAGGVEAFLSTGKAPNPSLRVVGTVADSAGPTPSWKSVVATGGIEQADSRVSALAVCGGGVKAPHATVITTAAPGPTAAASDALATATCPAGTVLVGGGAAVSLVDGREGPPQYFVTGSFPSSPNGTPAATGAVTTSWTAIGALGGMGMTNGQVRAVAVCLPGSPASVTVVVSTFLGPTAAQTAREVTATCPAHTVLTGGGVYTGPAQLQHTLQGLHLRGSFPSGPLGAAAAPGTSAHSWSVIANAGGILAVGARTTAFALCTHD